MRYLWDREAERRARPCTLTDWARARARVVLIPVARLLGRLGVRANTVTVVGFVLQIGVGLLFLLGRVRLGGALLLVVAPLDALDGAVARATGTGDLFGAFLDSTLDRLSDVALILGLAGYRFQQGAFLEVTLLLVALVFALMVSYARARAESLGTCCKVGLMTRLERVLLIGMLSALKLTTLLAWTLAVLSIVTFLQRVVHVYLACSHQE